MVNRQRFECVADRQRFSNQFKTLKANSGKSVKLHQVIWGGLSQSACPEGLQTPILSCASRSLVRQVDDGSSRLMKVDQG